MLLAIIHKIRANFIKPHENFIISLQNFQNPYKIHTHRCIIIVLCKFCIIQMYTTAFCCPTGLRVNVLFLYCFHTELSCNVCFALLNPMRSVMDFCFYNVIEFFIHRVQEFFTFCSGHVCFWRGTPW